ncbi:DUF6342 family protein [Nocardia inohanensis]|uniref:DUF6342 family protein n=1 Tax=Nocardia inohanensis TaxID=209246 RepID=UPI000829AD8D|nr:DUF6342 family protein [Nocardia inohanensis]
MPDVDLGLATDWEDGEMHGLVKLRQNQRYPNSAKKDVLISGPVGMELSVNTNLEVTQDSDKIFFTTFVGGTKKIIAILDSDGKLFIAGRLYQNCTDLKYT